MRVIVAVDGSIEADRALDLAAGLGLPADTRFRVVSVIDQGPVEPDVAWQKYVVGSPHGPDTRYPHLMTALETARLNLETAGYTGVDSILLDGRPAKAIIDEARDYDADLIVVGHRGRGAIASTLLGSTSAEVVERAPCPVLIVREPHLRSVVLAVDGMDSSRQAVEVVARWPIFEHLPITVVSVADVRIPITVEVQPGLYEQIMQSYVESVDQARIENATFAQHAADQLTEAGRTATVDVREGAPAASIVEAAKAGGADLIVMGTRGHTGLVRIALGSTARSVMLHAPCSVLVVRGRPVDPATEVEPDLAVSRPS